MELINRDRYGIPLEKPYYRLTDDERKRIKEILAELSSIFMAESVSLSVRDIGLETTDYVIDITRSRHN